MQNHVTRLKAGDRAPGFNEKDEKGNMVSLQDLKGKKVVLYFYPQDNTPTCTKEACNLRDNYSRLKRKGYRIIGVSPDEAKKHQKFIQKFDLPFPLLADTEKKIICAYDVWGPKQFMGRIFDGVARTTFVIDENGVIEKVITKVKSGEHADQILGK